MNAHGPACDERLHGRRPTGDEILSKVTPPQPGLPAVDRGRGATAGRRDHDRLVMDGKQRLHLATGRPIGWYPAKDLIDGHRRHPQQGQRSQGLLSFPPRSAVGHRRVLPHLPGLDPTSSITDNQFAPGALYRGPAGRRTSGSGADRGRRRYYQREPAGHLCRTFFLNFPTLTTAW